MNAEAPIAPPHAVEAEQVVLANIEVEQALIGAALAYPDGYPAAAFLEPEHFFDPLHQRIWKVIATLRASAREASPVTMKRYFQGDEGMKDAGGVAYLARLKAGAGALRSVPEYAQIILDLAIRRGVIESQKAFQEAISAPSPDMPAARVVGEHQDELAKLVEMADAGQHTGGMAGSIMSRTLQSIEEARQGRGILWSWGLRCMDRAFGKMRPAKLTILAGRPSQGKTTLATCIVRAAVEANRGSEARPDLAAAFYSLEMSGDELSSRTAAEIAWEPDRRIEYQAADEGRIDSQEFYRLMQAQQRIEQLPIWFDDRADRTVQSIAIDARRVARRVAAQGKHLGLIVVDHLGYIRRPMQRGVSTSDELGIILKGLKALGKELRANVLLLCQLSREVEKRENKRPMLADLRSSGEIEQDADTVLFVYREAYYLERAADTGDEQARALAEQKRDQGEVICAKNRGGRVGKVDMFVDLGCSVFRDPETLQTRGMF